MQMESIAKELDRIAPRKLARTWDNPGWQVRLEDTNVRRILLAVDVTHEVLQEASSLGANLIISHHPLIFEPLRSINPDAYKSRVVLEAIRSGINIFSMHTNLDVCPHGTSFALAECIGLQNIEFVTSLDEDAPFPVGWGAQGTFEDAVSLHALEDLVRKNLKTNLVRLITQNTQLSINRVAVGGGSLSSIIPDVIARGIQVYITSDLKYHAAQEAVENGLSLIDVDHFFAERPVLTKLSDMLSEITEVSISVSTVITSPFHSEAVSSLPPITREE